MRRTAPPPTRTEIGDAFGVEVGELRPHGDGWESVGFTDGTWFVKVWHEGTPANLAMLERLDLPVPAPVRTLAGELTATSAAGTIGLFPFVSGRPATDDDWELIARTVRRVHEHDVVDLDLGPPWIDVTAIPELRERLDHPWIVDRRREVEAHLERLEVVIERARLIDVAPVLCHTDLHGGNLLVDDDGEIAAIFDWDWAVAGPREHDLWLAFDHADPTAFLHAYGAAGLDLVHLELALLTRGVQDLAARVERERDREGVETWGFDRLRRVDADLQLASSFS